MQAPRAPQRTCTPRQCAPFDLPQPHTPNTNIPTSSQPSTASYKTIPFTFYAFALSPPTHSHHNLHAPTPARTQWYIAPLYEDAHAHAGHTPKPTPTHLPHYPTHSTPPCVGTSCHRTSHTTPTHNGTSMPHNLNFTPFPEHAITFHKPMISRHS